MGASPPCRFYLQLRFTSEIFQTSCYNYYVPLRERPR
jgi:hypothetical protein